MPTPRTASTSPDAGQRQQQDHRVAHAGQARGLVHVDPFGDRPTGRTPGDSNIVQVAAAVVRRAGMSPSYGTSSTDSNIPMSLAIPAITIDSGGTPEAVHRRIWEELSGRWPGRFPPPGADA